MSLAAQMAELGIPWTVRAKQKIYAELFNTKSRPEAKTSDRDSVFFIMVYEGQMKVVTVTAVAASVSHGVAKPSLILLI